MTSEDDRDLGPAVTVAYIHQNDVAYSWHHSMTELLGFDLNNSLRVLRGGYVAMRCGTGNLVEARNQGVAEFLANRDSEWLLWIDTDMGFPPDTIEQLLAVADPAQRPVVGALCFSQREGAADGLGGFETAAAPTIYDWAKLSALQADGTSAEQQGFRIRMEYPRDALVQCAGTGSACILIHRSVFEKLATEFGPTWYNRIPNESIGELTSEDLSFCMRLAKVGIPLFVHTGVKTTHMKTQWVGEQTFLRQQPPPPATAETAVIVPVLGRPQNAAPFMRSLRASTGLATVYAVCDTDDTEAIEAWRKAGAVIFDRHPGERPGTFAEKVNTGCRWTSEPWLFFVGDDVRFHPGWLDRAQAAAGQRYAVVGTNDLANPRVTSGQHATHLLIRRDYIREVGASWDGPGIVAHGGYGHWFVDDEIVTAAKQRGVWTMALDAIVEHLHPLFGKADDDDVYALGRSRADADRALFEARLVEHAS